MEFLVGSGMLLFCAWNGFQALTVDELELNLRWYAQTIISGLGGLYVMIPEITKFISKIFDNTNSLSKLDNFDKYRKDFECLSYLRDRCLEEGSKEGLDLVVSLNTTLFKKTLP